ncbi:MAG: hypothetical protein SCK57_09220 [Bacillota bacterium]|nr:hypothetical protein [Bacillota bacterium]MDW7677828.1 hypothetical protein [Bacillota bacterium]
MKPKCRLVGENGNIFNLMGLASTALKKAGLSDQSKEMIGRITSGAGSYEEAIAIIMEYVEVE